MNTATACRCLSLALLLSACGPSAPVPPTEPSLSIPRRDPPRVDTVALDPTLARSIQSGREAVLAQPHSAAAWGAFGQVLHAAEFYPEALDCYTSALDRDPASVRWRYLVGLLQLPHDPESALSHLREAAQAAAPDDPAPALRLAHALVEHGRFAEGATHLDKLLAIVPHHPAARLELARVRLAEGQLPLAAQALTPCLTNLYTARPALMLLSQIRAREGENEAAVDLARRAESMPRPPDWPDPYLREIRQLQGDRARRADRVATLLAQGRLDDAERRLAELLHEAPEDPEILLLLGRLHFQQGRCADAETRFREHLAAREDSLNGWIQLALALLCQQHWTEALPPLERAIALKPDFAQAHANLGLAHARLGNTPSAIRAYREALRHRPADAATHAALAEQLALTGDASAARNHARQALALQPELPRALQVLRILNEDRNAEGSPSR
ncbi:MAG: tetratricopeptide repeat protein [Verrucomicrobiae bacterium]|nr:tetratricopeptide repeat protein [Verrucomicrobiae bacterium]